MSYNQTEKGNSTGYSTLSDDTRDDTPLTNGGATQSKVSSPSCWSLIKVATTKRFFVISCLIFISVIVLVSVLATTLPKGSSNKTKNIIIMISDGYGPAQATLGRAYKNIVVMKKNISEPQPFAPLPLDTILIGSSRTKSSNSLVTDSAAGATAYSCRKKAVNGYVGVDYNATPCGTLMEAAIAQGMKTGVVVTSRITHATPASFTSHVLFRDNEALIAVQQLNISVDIYMGGGKGYFIPQSVSGSKRKDNFDGLALAAQKGYKVATDKAGFDSITDTPSDLPVFAVLKNSHMSYEIDRNPTLEPSLAEMVSKAIKKLHSATQDSDTGFMLLIEGSRIDMAGHDNDPATLAKEILAYQDAVQVVLDYVSANGNTLVLSTSDHETGGLSLGRQPDYMEYPEYLWDPAPLALPTNSTEVLASAVLSYSGNVTDYLINDVLPLRLGVKSFTSNDIDKVLDGLALCKNGSDLFYIQKPLNILVSNAAGVAWTTPGHTGVDVNLYGTGDYSEQFVGNYENIEIGKKIETLFGFDLDKITEKVKSIPIA